MKYASFFLIISIVLLSCTKEEDSIKEVVGNTYNQLLKDIDFRLIDSTNLSNELNRIIKINNEIELADMKKLEAIHSTDKPIMIEGDIFSSNYEGITSYEIKSITIEGQRARSVMYFEYKYTKPVYHWTDTLLLIKESNKWKIDDMIYFNHDTATLSMKNILNSNITDYKNNSNFQN